MPEAKIECPSGLVIEARGLRTSEVNLLANRKAAKQGQTTDMILGACHLRTLDAGPYEVPGAGPAAALDWGRVHVGDRLYALLRIRALTYGEEYTFGVNCAERACRERFEWDFRLCDLPVKPLPEAARAALRGDGILSVKWQGKVLRFRLMRGNDEHRAARMTPEQRASLTYALNARIVGIEGVEEKDKLRYLNDLEAGDAVDLRDLLDEHDGGVDLDFQVECPHCGAIQDIRLPFGIEFFLPRKKKAPTLT